MNDVQNKLNKNETVKVIRHINTTRFWLLKRQEPVSRFKLYYVSTKLGMVDIPKFFLN